MLLRAFLLMLFSSSVWSAGITIDINLDMTIEEIEYGDLSDYGDLGKPDDSEQNIENEEPVDTSPRIKFKPMGVCSEESSETYELPAWLPSDLVFKSKSLPYFGSEYETLNVYDDLNWSIFDSVLQQVTRSWDDECSLNPRIVALETNIENISEVMFVKDLEISVLKAPNVHWFNSQNEQTYELIKNLPKGYTKWVSIIDDDLYVSLVNGYISGVWRLDIENEKLQNTSATSLDLIMRVGNNLAFITSNSSNTRVKFKKTRKEFKLDTDSVVPFSTEDGVILQYLKDEDVAFKWLDGYQVMDVQFQNGYSDLLDCQQSKNQVFCWGVQDESESELTLWRLSLSKFGVPRFVVDTKFNANLLSNKSVEYILYSEGARHIVVSESDRLGLLALTSDTSVYNEVGEYNILTLEDGSALVLYEFLNGEIVVKSLSSKDQMVLSPLIEVEDMVVPGSQGESPVTDDEFEEREKDAVNSQEHERAELSGAFSIYYIFSITLLLLILPRRRR